MKKRKLAKILVMGLIFIMSLSLTACSKKTTRDSNYQYKTEKEVKKAIENKDKLTLLDIQVKEDYDKHHIKGTIPTYAYPVKSNSDKEKLDNVLSTLEKNNDPILVICPGGAGGATRTIDYLKGKGISKNRLYILENGQSGWTYDNLLEK